MKDDRFLPLATSLAGFILLGCGGVTTAPEHPTAIGQAARVGALEVGDHHGRFTEGDEQLQNGAYAHRFSAHLSPGQRYRITMSSEELDSMLTLSGPGEISLRNDDAFPGTLDSVLDFEPAVEGRYELVATTIGRATGDYALTVVASPAAGSATC